MKTCMKINFGLGSNSHRAGPNEILTFLPVQTSKTTSTVRYEIHYEIRQIINDANADQPDRRLVYFQNVEDKYKQK
jgi:hypothetical protein